MKKITKLKLCAWVLATLTVVMLASGIQLEVSPAGAPLWVWLHIALGTAFFAFIFWHLQLNSQALRLNRRNSGKKSGKGNLWLGLFFLLTLISAVIATAHWIATPVHSSIGGVHGKIAYIFIIMAIVHTWRHLNFFGIKKRSRS